MEISKLRIHVVVDNLAVNPGKILGEWGLALLVEIEYEDGTTKYVLYDTGQSGTALLNNVEQMRLPLEKVSHIVLSHGHYDHTGGLVKVLERLNALGVRPHVIAHPAIFERKLVVRKGEVKYIGVPSRREEIETRSWLILTRDPMSVVPSVLFSGEVLRYGYPEYTPDMYVAHPDGRLIRDSMSDDTALIVQTRRGLVILTGCGHSGILNIIEHARALTKVQKIFAIIGGLHQERETRENIEKLCDELARRGVELIVPLHCTGVRATSIMLNKLGDKVVIAGAGSSITIPI